MYIWFDLENGEECITGGLYDCRACELSCEEAECSQRFNGKSNSVFHKGFLGSAMVRFLALDIDRLTENISNAINAALSCDDTFSEEQRHQIWLNEFESTRAMIGEQYWDIYNKLETLDDFYTSFVLYPDEMPGIKDYFWMKIKSSFIATECMQAYINCSCDDERFLDIERFLTVDKSFYARDDVPVTGKMLNIAEIKYPLGEFSIDHLPSKEAFIDSVQRFIDNTQEMPCIVDTSKYSTVYEFSFLDDLLRISLFEVIKSGLKIKRCANCNKPFIPHRRSDAIYCDRPAPQNTEKTCKDYGAIKTYQSNLNKSISMQLYRKIYMSKQMLVKRNPDIEGYARSFDAFKIESKRWKAEVKAGKKTEAEYIEWLKAVKEKKVL